MSEHLPDKLSPQEIESLVRRVVTRTLGQTARPQRPLLDEETVRQLPANSTQPVASGTLVTPLARQAALERRIILQETPPNPVSNTGSTQFDGEQTVAIGADHGGYNLKEQLKTAIAAAGYRLTDCGTHGTESVDYPDYAYAVAQLVANGRCARGIIIDGAGIGSCMAANKVNGVRAAMCYDQATAVNSREHNNANVLTLGAGLIGPNLARQIVETWLGTEFAGGRHARRVAKIDEIGQRYFKDRGKR